MFSNGDRQAILLTSSLFYRQGCSQAKIECTHKPAWGPGGTCGPLAGSGQSPNGFLEGKALGAPQSSPFRDLFTLK